MTDDFALREQRVRRLVRELLPPLVFPRVHKLSVEAHVVAGEPIPAARALAGKYEPFAEGEAWGGAWSTVWFHLSGRVPDAWAGSNVVVRIGLGYDLMPGFGAEGLLYEGTRPLQGINPRHSYAPLTAWAAGGETVDWHLEAAANPCPPWGSPEWPDLMPDYSGTPLYRLDRAELAVRDVELEAALYDLDVLLDLSVALGAGEGRARRILEILDDVALAAGSSEPAQRTLEARPLWSGLLEEATEGARHKVTAVGHAHIDSAWLWPIRETRRKCARTFSTALGLMANNPDYVFVCSQAQQHAFVEEDHPDLFAEMQGAARRGNFEPVGSMWVEPDTNIPSGESLLRQLVHGKRFFIDRYGIETEDCWLPDAFGYSGNLPQILRSAGVRYFLTQKLSWNETDRFPHHTFYWQGIDGSEVLAHFPPTDTYNGEMRAAELLKGERAFAEQGVSDRSLYAFGYGDGGGGPTEQMLERYRRLRRSGGCEVGLGTAVGFFRRVEAEADEREALAEAAQPGTVRTAHGPRRGGLPRWTGELYLERHRAVQTTQAALKLANRRCEALLREAELWSLAAGVDYPDEELVSLWKTLLLHQFHDILPGSSIHWVNVEAVKTLARVQERADALARRSCSRLASGAGTQRLLFNPATQARREVVEIDGEPRYVALPGLGWSPFVDRSDEVMPVALAAEDGSWVVSNGLVTARVDGHGEVISFLDAETGRDVIAPSGRGNVLQLHDDRPRDTDAWDVDRGTFDRAQELSDVDSVATRHDRLRASVVVERSFGHSRIRQEIRLDAGSRRLDFACDADWHEDHKFLKVAFAVDVLAPRASYEIQFGHIARPTHANTSWDEARFEVPAQRWADLSEAGFGAALLNDCKYGYDVRANVMRLSLLRAPTWPDPKSDRGHHSFTYSLLAHRGLASDLRTVVAEAERLNWPIRIHSAGEPSVVAAATPTPPEGSVLSVSGAQVSALKRADSGAGTVVRLYEPSGGRSDVVLHSPSRELTRLVRLDTLERPLEGCEPIPADGDGVARFSMRPFELVTLRLDYRD